MLEAPVQLATITQELKDAATTAKASLATYQENRAKAIEKLQEYHAKRLDYFWEEMKKRDLSWCTKCGETFPANQAQLIFATGVRERTSGYGNSGYSLSNFSQLYLACASCQKCMLDYHGHVGEWDTYANAQTKFYAFVASKRDDGIYVCMFGRESKLDEKQAAVGVIEDFRIKGIVKNWDGFPPKLTLDDSCQIVPTS